MTFDIISDIHLDFWVDPRKSGDRQRRLIETFVDGWYENPNDYTDAIIIAGDIGHYNKQNILLLEELKRRYRYVIATWGNHDLYLVSARQKSLYNDSLHRLFDFIEEARRIDGVFMLDGLAEDRIEIEDVVIWGSGMWYDVKKEDEQLWRKSMSDARMIDMGEVWHTEISDRGEYVRYRFDPDGFAFLEQMKLRSIETPVDVIVTHIPPVFVRNQTPTDRFYGFDGSEAIEYYQPLYWVCGHWHQPFEIKKGETRIVCHPLGYPEERQDKFSIKRISVSKGVR